MLQATTFSIQNSVNAFTPYLNVAKEYVTNKTHEVTNAFQSIVGQAKEVNFEDFKVKVLSSCESAKNSLNFETFNQKTSELVNFATPLLPYGFAVTAGIVCSRGLMKEGGKLSKIAQAIFGGAAIYAAYTHNPDTLPFALAAGLGTAAGIWTERRVAEEEFNPCDLCSIKL